MKCKRKSVGGSGAREVRARGGFAALALALVVALTMVPGRAWADVLDLPSIDGVTGDNIGWVYPWGPRQGCNALAEVLGYDWDSLSDEVQDRILTEDVENGYNPFTYIIETTNNNPNFPKFYNLQDSYEGVPVMSELTSWITSTFGLNKIWVFNISSEDFANAKAHMKKWVFARPPEVDPGMSHGAGSYDPVTGNIVMVPAMTSGSISVNGLSIGNRNSGAYAEYITGNVNVGDNTTFDDLPILCVIVTTTNIQLWFGDIDSFEILYDDEGYASGLTNKGTEKCWLWNVMIDGTDFVRSLSYSGNSSPYQVAVNYQFSGTPQKFPQGNDTNGIAYGREVRPNRSFGWIGVLWVATSSGGTITPGYDPEIRPDDPPDVPEPDVPGYDPVVPGTHEHDDEDTYITVKVDLDNWNTVYYTITQINNNTQTTYNDPSSGSDVLDVLRNWYSDWQHHTQDLKQWFDHMQAQLVDSMQKLNEGFNLSIWNGINAIRSAIDDQNQQIVDAANNISNNLDEMSEWIVTELDEIITGAINSIGEYFEDAVSSLEYYLKDVAEYLVKSLNFEFDDGGIRSLLQRILRKIPGNTAAPDVGLDPEGFWDWLSRMVEEFFSDLMDDATQGIEDVAEGLLALATKFPFSIPWDIYAIMVLFVAEPVTPVFDFPMPVPEVIDQQGYVELEVDLTPYDDVAAVLRHLQTLAFIIWICGQVPGWLNQLKITGGKKDD